MTFEGTNRVAWLDLEDREHPRLTSRSVLPEGPPRLLDSPGGPWVVPTPDRDALVADVGGDAPRLVIQASPQGAGLEIISGKTHLFPLRGRMNLSAQRPTGLAFDRDRGLLAVANRSGGVHLIAIEPRAEEDRPRGDVAVSGRESRSSIAEAPGDRPRQPFALSAASPARPISDAVRGESLPGAPDPPAVTSTPSSSQILHIPADRPPNPEDAGDPCGLRVGEL